MSNTSIDNDDPFGICSNCISPLVPSEPSMDEYVKVIQVNEDRSIRSSSRRKNSSRLLSRFKREPGSFTDIPHTQYESSSHSYFRPTSIEFESLTPAAPSTITEHQTDTATQRRPEPPLPIVSETIVQETQSFDHVESILSEVKLPENHLLAVDGHIDNLIKDSGEVPKQAVVIEHDKKETDIEHSSKPIIDTDDKEPAVDNKGPDVAPKISEVIAEAVPKQTENEVPKAVQVAEEKSNPVPDTISAAFTDIKVPDQAKEVPMVPFDQSDKISQLENRITLLEAKLSEIMAQFKDIATVTKPPETQEVVKPVAVVEPKDKVYVPYIYSNRFTTIDNQTTLHDNTLQMKVTLASLMVNNENDKLYPFGDEIIAMKFPMQILILRFQNDKATGTVQGVLQLENDKYVINLDPDSYNIEGTKVNFTTLELPITYVLDSDLLV